MFNNLIAFIILIFLTIAVLIYTCAGLKFIFAYRRRKGLTLYYLMGIFIGIFGGFIFFYNLKITKNAVYFSIQFERWWVMTIISILVGGILSLIIFKKISKK